MRACPVPHSTNSISCPTCIPVRIDAEGARGSSPRGWSRPRAGAPVQARRRPRCSDPLMAPPRTPERRVVGRHAEAGRKRRAKACGVGPRSGASGAVGAPLARADEAVAAAPRASPKARTPAATSAVGTTIRRLRSARATRDVVGEPPAATRSRGALPAHREEVLEPPHASWIGLERTPALRAPRPPLHGRPRRDPSRRGGG